MQAAKLPTAAAIIFFLGTEHAAGQAPSVLRRRATQPDLQGFWALTTVTPLERPADLKNKPFFTEQEARDWELNYFRRRRSESLEARTSPEATETWNEPGKVVPSRRTSLIVDPPDGLIPFRPDSPPARPETFDDPEARPLSERCIVWTEGPPMIPSGITGHLQIVQAPGYVVIFNEMVHHARIVPLDGRPHLPGHISQWVGDSRGHWENELLVVETTNFTGLTRFRRSSAALQVVERFRRVDADTIYYAFTVTDPATYTKPWTAEMVMTRMDVPLFEYACHEGNYTLTNVLSGARAIEKRNEATASPR